MTRAKAEGFLTMDGSMVTSQRDAALIDLREELVKHLGWQPAYATYNALRYILTPETTTLKELLQEALEHS